jgi:ketosteroid isomerase-like protein
MASRELDRIDELYAAFDRGDGNAMSACYAPDATFSDPVFVGLRGEEPGAMWRMLTARSRDLAVELVERSATGDRGAARWIARYTFGQTGRLVVNDVSSTFRFRDGLIAEQRDDFDFARWARQALGTPGLLLGRTPYLRGKVRRTARSGLDAFLAAERR